MIKNMHCPLLGIQLEKNRWLALDSITLHFYFIHKGNHHHTWRNLKQKGWHFVTWLVLSYSLRLSLSLKELGVCMEVRVRWASFVHLRYIELLAQVNMEWNIKDNCNTEVIQSYSSFRDIYQYVRLPRAISKSAHFPQKQILLIATIKQSSVLPPHVHIVSQQS